MDLVLFGIVVLGLLEFLCFGLLIVMTFINVLRNKDKTTSTLRNLVSLSLYLIFRMLFLPFFISAIFMDTSFQFTILPLLSKIAAIMLAVWWNIIMLLPGFTIWYCRAKYGIGNRRLPTSKTEIVNQYKYIIILPVYKEKLDLLLYGVHSILNSNYSKELIELHVSFDSDDSSEQRDLYNAFLNHFNVTNEHPNDINTTVSKHVYVPGKGKSKGRRNGSSSSDSNNGSEETEIGGGGSGYEEGGYVMIYIHKWKHSGKRLTQAQTFNFIEKGMQSRGDLFLNETIVLLTDSDNYLYDNALYNLSCNFTKHPTKYAFAGYMSCMSWSMTGWARLNPMRWIQDAEYVGGEINRGIELLMGTVNCMPGGFTAVRYSALLLVAPTYFSKLSDTNITDFHRNHLGEDRYLTHLMHQTFPRCSMGFAPSARAKTDPPTSVMAMIKQRRRWLLGAISNEAYMLSDSIIWRRYPGLQIFKLFQLAWKGTTAGQIVLSWLVVTSWKSSSFKDGALPFVYSVGIPFIINWILVGITGISIGHYKVIFVYPLMHVITAVVAFLTDIYTIFTWRKRTWGGARFSAAKKKVVEIGVEITEVVEVVDSTPELFLV